MAKKPTLLPRAQSLTTRLQLERAKLKAIAYGDRIPPHGTTRADAVTRLREVNTELNKLYAAGR